MLKFRVDMSEARRKSNENSASGMHSKEENVKPVVYEEAIPYDLLASPITVACAADLPITANSDAHTPMTANIDAESRMTANVDAEPPITSNNGAEQMISNTSSCDLTLMAPTSDNNQIVSTVIDCDPRSHDTVAGDLDPPMLGITSLTVSPCKAFKSPSNEKDLHEAILGVVSSKNNNTIRRRQWSIPESDSGDEFMAKQGNWSVTESTNIVSVTADRPSNRFNLPSDSEEEDPYSMAKSPTLSVKSVEPPVPPPVSTIPRKPSLKPAHTDVAVLPETDESSFEPRQKLTLNPFVDLKKRSYASETDTYDEIGYGSVDETTPPNIEGQSEPRFQFTLSKSRLRLNPTTKTTDDTYAEIPRKIPWNFPSSSDDDEEQEPVRRHKKLNTSTAEVRRQESTSDEDEKPLLPPKMWEPVNKAQNCLVPDGAAGQKGIGDSPRESWQNEQDITIEYSALQRSVPKKESLLGPESSPTTTHSSGFENYDNTDALSEQSEASSKAVTDYEESCACVDVDQLSLDSCGRRPKRIVETHETHEIVPADNNEDDIVERIIETQTITEKLDDKHAFTEYNPGDYPNYLDDDDGFVSHIFTLGRTLEKGEKKKRSKDFAFVENPFSVPEPMIETMPLEKKTVKQKITTLRKKKKANDDENLYAEVTLADENVSQADGDAIDDDESDDYDHMNSLSRDVKRWSEPADQYARTEVDDTRRQTGDEGGACDKVGASNANCQLLYEHVSENNDFSQHEISDRKKETKAEKKSIFRGIKRLLKKKDKNLDACKVDPSILDDDYQEFVP